MTYPPPPGYGQQPQQPGYPPQQPGGYSPQPPPGQPQQPGYPPQQGGYPQQPGGYPPPPPGGGYGAPPPMPPGGGGNGFGQFAKDTGKGLLWKIVPVILVVVGLGIYFLVKVAGGDSISDAASDLSDSDTSANVAAGDCLVQDLESLTSTTDDPTADLVTDCEGTEAFWSIDKVDEDPDLRADSLGDLESTDGVSAACGPEALGSYFGQAWTSYYYVYDWEGGKVDYLLCISAIEKEDANGRLPVIPDAGTCTDSDPEYWYTLDCTDAGALYKVDEVETYEPPIEESAFDSSTAVGGCVNSGYYSTPIYGGDGLIYGAMCMSDNL
ncbi:hypothetical protein LO763_06480 [Glycomyces sp. A-F 0318]|uniref:hypothetical protein n=1 Tax=Glycomyces amatae TaxID=2881355 RepID=UPI001E5EA7BC|nr:hypothetical protein [Glycomyces amatae]MCD0443271.1 hypothetical protein [Glycomyces amatae]